MSCPLQQIVEHGTLGTLMLLVLLSEEDLRVRLDSVVILLEETQKAGLRKQPAFPFAPVLCSFLSQLLPADKFRLGRVLLLERSGLDVASAHIIGNDDPLARCRSRSGRTLPETCFGEQALAFASVMGNLQPEFVDQVVLQESLDEIPAAVHVDLGTGLSFSFLTAFATSPLISSALLQPSFFSVLEATYFFALLKGPAKGFFASV